MKLLSAVFLLAATTVTINPAVAAIDQEFVPISWGTESNVGAGGDVEWAQTFTVGQTGTLTGIDIWVDRSAAIALPLLYQIRTTVAGIPSEADVGSSILVSGSLDASEVPIKAPGNPRSDLTHVDFGNASIDVLSGQVLAIVLQSNDPGTGCCGFTYSWMGAAGATSYSTGNAYLRAEGGIFPTWTVQNQDNAFRTYVTPVPEPSTALLVIISIAALAARRGPTLTS